MDQPKYSDMTNKQLEFARDLGGATYLSAYVHLMARELGVDDSDLVSVNDMALPMLEPLNIALECCWRATMKDHAGQAEAMGRFRRAVEAL